MDDRNQCRRRVCSENLGGIECLTPFGINANYLRTVPLGDIAHPLAEDPVDAHHHRIARSHEVDERSLHPR